jgi:hypothetical protein
MHTASDAHCIRCCSFLRASAVDTPPSLVSIFFIFHAVCCLSHPPSALFFFSILARLPSVIFCAYVAGMQGTHLPNTKSALENVRKAFSLISAPDVGGVDQPKSANFAVQSGRIDIKGVRFA